MSKEIEAACEAAIQLERIPKTAQYQKDALLKKMAKEKQLRRMTSQDKDEYLLEAIEADIAVAADLVSQLNPSIMRQDLGDVFNGLLRKVSERRKMIRHKDEE